eukprot:3156903-Pleurochrysis_carterae.AAC.1
MVGVGRMRSDWNVALLQDVVAPSYGQMLLYARTIVPKISDFYQLWPQAQPAEPWAGMVSVLYRVLAQQPLLHSEYDGG